MAQHPSKVYPGRKWVFWQYSGSGLSHGVRGRIDLNVFHGSEDDWHDWVARGRGIGAAAACGDKAQSIAASLGHGQDG